VTHTSGVELIVGTLSCIADRRLTLGPDFRLLRYDLTVPGGRRTGRAVRAWPVHGHGVFDACFLSLPY